MANSGEILGALLRRCPVLVPCGRSIMEACDLLTSCFRSGSKLLLCGNGGSAADADHISAELLKGFRSRRPVSDGCPLAADLREQLQGALPAIPLPNFTALLTAFANDCHPENSFAQLVFALGKRGDVLLSLSTSGNSTNVLRASETARALGLGVVGLSGASGGALAALCDVCICVPEQETYRIQELHLPIYHSICAVVEQNIFNKHRDLPRAARNFNKLPSSRKKSPQPKQARRRAVDK